MVGYGNLMANLLNIGHNSKYGVPSTLRAVFVDVSGNNNVRSTPRAENEDAK